MPNNTSNLTQSNPKPVMRGGVKKSAGGSIGRKPSVGREEPKVNPYKLPSVPAGVTLDDDGRKAWATALGELERGVNRHMFRLWIEPLRFVGVSKDSVVLTGDYRLARWVARRYGSVIGDVCRGLGFRGALICEEGER